MRIRDALESDAETLAAAIDRPRDVVRDMIHDRSVRVAVEDGDDGSGASDGDDGNNSGGGDGASDGGDGNGSGGDDETVFGFVAFDVRDDTVHVTDFDGSGETVERLFEEPRRFARREEMGVEVVVPNDEETSGVIEASGFAAAGSGPRFGGRRTTRYRIEFEELDGRNSE